MKLSKKLMLFEEFNQANVAIKTDVNVTSSNKASSINPINSIRTEIASDVDSIINKLEDLAKNLETQDVSNESIEYLNENSDSILGSELYMIPIIAGGAAIAGTTYGGKKLFDFIRKTSAKKKARNEYATVDAIKTKAAQLEAAIADARDKSINDKLKDKISKMSEKLEAQKERASEIDSAIGEKYRKYDIDDYLSVLRAETKKKVAEIMLSSKVSPSIQQKFQQELKNAEQSLNRASEKAAESLKMAKQAGKNIPNDKKIANAEEKVKQLKQQLNNAIDDNKKKEINDQISIIRDSIKKIKGLETKGKDKTTLDKSEVDKTNNSKEGMLNRINALIKKAEESGDDIKLQKAKDLKAKIEAKESLLFNYRSEIYLLEKELIQLENIELF